VVSDPNDLTHNPVDDARGNAEALLEMKEQLGLKISLFWRDSLP